MLDRCVEAASGGKPAPAAALPEAVLAQALRRMAEADPGATTELALLCPACATSWNAPFDVVTYFWSELEMWAERILAEVHLLASAYAWHERDILALSPLRRRRYLEMVQA